MKTTAVEQAIHRHFLVHDLLVNTHADAAMRWLPYVAVLAAKACRVRARSPWPAQVAEAAVGTALRCLVVHELKNVTSEHRPAPYRDHRSFPSGHTASSFASAQFMHRELKGALPVLSCTGYVCAATVALLRLIKNRHWLRDVLAGAAIGMVSAAAAAQLVAKTCEVMAVRSPPEATAATVIVS